MVCVNGRFAGEAGPGQPLALPVAPGGALYLEYKPLTGAGMALARRLVLSGGTPLPESLSEASGLSCVVWPGGALEIEFSPVVSAVASFLLEGLPAEVVMDLATDMFLVIVRGESAGGEAVA